MSCRCDDVLCSVWVWVGFDWFGLACLWPRTSLHFTDGEHSTRGSATAYLHSLFLTQHTTLATSFRFNSNFNFIYILLIITEILTTEYRGGRGGIEPGRTF